MTSTVASPSRAGRKRSEATRRRILRAAHALLVERGFRAVTIEGIAERARAGKVTIYRWWPSKAAVVFEAFLEHLDRTVAFVHTKDPLGDLGAYMQDFADVLGGPTGTLLAGLLAEGVLDPDVGRAYLQHWQKPRRAEARQHLERACAAGLVPSCCDIDLILDLCFGPLYFRLLVQHAPLNRAYAGQVFAAVRRSVECGA